MTKVNDTIAIQFIKGKNEEDLPEIHLFRNTDGKKGQAIYKFKNSTTITLENYNSIQKMSLIDEEGEISTRKLDLSITDNKTIEINSTYSWHSEKEFERFMRFAEKYASSHTNY